MNQGASRDALAAAAAELEQVIESDRADTDALGDELFAVGRLLSRQTALRRALWDRSRSGTDRAGLLDTMLAAQLSDPTRKVLRTAVGQRWASPRDLADAVEDLAVRAVVASADQAGALDRLEDELFRFRRIMVGDQDLRSALTGEVDVDRKSALLDALIGGKVADQTRTLIDQAVLARSSRNVEHTLERYSGVAAARRERLVAHVRSVTDLTAEQRDRLTAALSRLYGRSVALNVEIDATVLGGLAVRLGDEVVDATVLARLDEARRRLAG
ncbi:MAG: F0F1 ATP synthase subunit delta [Actinomycetes bacterium]